MNYKQTGYSVAEVAQMFRVIPQTIRNWIDQGKLSARVDGKIMPGRHRRIRIEREHIAEYLEQHRGDYDIELLRAFRPEKVEQEYQEAMQGIKTYAEAPKHVSCQVLIDGRICVANVSKETAAGILNLLLNDPVCKCSELTIKTAK